MEAERKSKEAEQEADREIKQKTLELKKRQLERDGEMDGLQAEINAFAQVDETGLPIAQKSSNGHEGTLLDLSVTEMLNWGDKVNKYTCEYKAPPTRGEQHTTDIQYKMSNTDASPCLPRRNPDTPLGAPGATPLQNSSEGPLNSVGHNIGLLPMNIGAKTVKFDTSTAVNLGTLR